MEKFDFENSDWYFFRKFQIFAHFHDFSTKNSMETSEIPKILVVSTRKSENFVNRNFQNQISL